MSGVVKIYGILIVCVVVIFLMVNVNARVFVEEDLFEGSRTTQLSVLKESLQLGELFANGKYSIDTNDAIRRWSDHYKLNKDTKLTVVLDVLDIHESPPAIAIRLKGYADLLMSEENIELDYTNIVILDKKVP